MNTQYPIVMTLDAGGTNMVFSAIKGGEEIIQPVRFSTVSDDLELCLETIRKGFEAVKSLLSEEPVAISFAFPGPADYINGVIGDLPNFPAFRGGVALGPFLEEHFKIPVFINNDGNLFAYGEALAGILPEVNSRLQSEGNLKQYKNLLGVTFGTGFGGGIVIDGNLLKGDNQLANNLWCLPNKKHSACIAEESVSIRSVQRVYAELSGDPSDLTPKEIFDIAEGHISGNKQAAIQAFAELGEVAGDIIATAITLIDGLIVIGGGLSGACKYILPALMKELKAQTGLLNGTRFQRLLVDVYNLDDDAEMNEFVKSSSTLVCVPGTDRKVVYDTTRRIGIALSHNGTSRSISLGAYWFAINELSKSKQS